MNVQRYLSQLLQLSVMGRVEARFFFHLVRDANAKKNSLRTSSTHAKYSGPKMQPGPRLLVDNNLTKTQGACSEKQDWIGEEVRGVGYIYET